MTKKEESPPLKIVDKLNATYETFYSGNVIIEARDIIIKQHELLKGFKKALTEHHEGLNITRDDEIGDLSLLDVADGYSESLLCDKTIELINMGEIV